MIDRQKIKPLVVLCVSIPIAIVGIFTWLWLKPPTNLCSSERMSNNPKVREIRAVKVIVQPWFGQHNVYGIFMIPEQYKHSPKYAIAMAVKGSNHLFAVDATSDLQYLDGVTAEPGYYLSRSYVPTREALGFMMQGAFGDLQQPCNWTLLLIER
ncbi:hypothetical protein TUMEXPCC7403_03525 [Tumidithrix helvetica PCC 7403]|uniref:hypothetical protein n=1 Tax=Tumidithrix helvetica TaxID=3457545 RepID=UPI003CB2BE7F